MSTTGDIDYECFLQDASDMHRMFRGSAAGLDQFKLLYATSARFDSVQCEMLWAVLTRERTPHLVEKVLRPAIWGGMGGALLAFWAAQFIPNPFG